MISVLDAFLAALIASATFLAVATPSLVGPVIVPSAPAVIDAELTATFTPAAVADVLTRLPSPVTAKDTSPSLRYLLPVEPVSAVRPIPLVVALTVSAFKPTVIVWLLTVAVTPLAPATLSFWFLRSTVPSCVPSVILRF